MLFPQSLKLLFFYAVLPILTRIALAAPEDYQRLTEALHREAESIKDDYCYACLRATVLVGFSLSEGVRMNLERSRDEDWYPYLGLAYEDLVCSIQSTSDEISVKLYFVISLLQPGYRFPSQLT